jgi:hypothetical protein
MIRSALLLSVLAALCGCTFKEEPPVRTLQAQPRPAAVRPAKPRDPIDALVAQLAPTGGIWRNGLSPILDLPATAPIEEVVAEFFQKVSYAEGETGSPTVKEIRRVQIDHSAGDDEYIAVLVDTKLGRKILLLQYSPAGGWWSRVYDV